jgi:5-methylcytosine-specific restriction endonuclease McrA
MPGQWSHLYETPQWRDLRRAQLRDHPSCYLCLQQGYDTPATIVDHDIPHRGDRRLFFDARNLRSMCKPHHDSTKARAERRGVMPGCDANGSPLDARHPWNRKERTQ